MAVLDFRRDGPVPRWIGPTVRAHAIDSELAIIGPATHWQRLYVRRSMLVDVLAALVAGVGAYLARWGTSWNVRYLPLVVLLPLLWMVVVAANRGYESRFLGVGSEEFRRVARAAVTLTAAFTFTAYLFNYALARGFVLVVLPLIVTLHALIHNRAPYAQAYPSLELTLTSVQDQPVARRVFRPADYLKAGQDEKQGFPANRDLDIKLHLDTTDLKPSGYRLFLFYPH